MTETATTYQDLIKEAFIDPIRSVTVIDDEYPTYQELLQQSNSEKMKKSNNIDRLLKISEMCHETHKWSLDVFDGQSPKIGEDNEIPDHLNHSDLLILDYHLDGEPPTDDGERARKIIKKLDSNNHFNIILVHTKGDDGEINGIYEDILFDLNLVKKSDYLDENAENIDKIEEWLDDNEDGAGYSWLSNDVNYPKLRVLNLLECTNEKLFLNIRNPNHLFNPYHSEIDDLSNKIGINKNDIIKWRLLEISKQQNIIFAKESRRDLNWNWIDSNINYIATGKVFISVVRKVSEDPKTELYNALCRSLNQFNAPPMHLLMAKIRHEIDEKGFEQAQDIISNRPAQAGWLYSLLSESNNIVAHDKAIDLHWEQLGRSAKPSLRKFSKNMFTVLLDKNNKKAIVKEFFRECINNVDESYGHLNAFKCSMPVVSQHFNTGTVFLLDDEYWVCLTPACDLVPNQKMAFWKDRIGSNHLVFNAIKLHEVDLILANKKANNNEYLYLNLEESSELQAFSFSKEGASSPTWDTFYAHGQGCFDSDNNVSISYVRTSSDILQVSESKVKAVAELRYEYALNLLQRLGVNQTRVGLDFIEKGCLW